MKVLRNAAGTGYDIVATPNDPDYSNAKLDPTLITSKGSLTVFIDFDSGTKPNVNTPDIWAAIGTAVADLTGALDVSVMNRGAALIKNRVAA